MAVADLFGGIDPGEHKLHPRLTHALYKPVPSAIHVLAHRSTHGLWVAVRSMTDTSRLSRRCAGHTNDMDTPQLLSTFAGKQIRKVLRARKGDTESSLGGC